MVPPLRSEFEDATQWAASGRHLSTRPPFLILPHLSPSSALIFIVTVSYPLLGLRVTSDKPSYEKSISRWSVLTTGQSVVLCPLSEMQWLDKWDNSGLIIPIFIFTQNMELSGRFGPRVLKEKIIVNRCELSQELLLRWSTIFLASKTRKKKTFTCNSEINSAINLSREKQFEFLWKCTGKMGWVRPLL